MESAFLATENGTAQHGFRIRTISTNGSLGWVQADGSGTFKTSNILASGGLVVNTNYLLLIGLNAGSTGGEKVWKNSTTGANWSQSLSVGATSTSASNRPSIAARAGAHGNPLANGYRLYGVYLFNEILDNTKAASVYAALESRHGRDYTP